MIENKVILQKNKDGLYNLICKQSPNPIAILPKDGIKGCIESLLYEPPFGIRVTSVIIEDETGKTVYEERLNTFYKRELAKELIKKLLCLSLDMTYESANECLEIVDTGINKCYEVGIYSAATAILQDSIGLDDRYLWIFD